jgi:hypothetical protein
MGIGDRLPARAVIVNHSSRLRAFDTALADLHRAEVEADKKRRKG